MFGCVCTSVCMHVSTNFYMYICMGECCIYICIYVSEHSFVLAIKNGFCLVEKCVVRVFYLSFNVWNILSLFRKIFHATTSDKLLFKKKRIIIRIFFSYSTPWQVTNMLNNSLHIKFLRNKFESKKKRLNNL